MFKGFNKAATEFLAGIRANNNKTWFEAHKDIYKSEVYEPMCELAQELFEPYSGIDDMMFKAGRIYKDPFLSPEVHYRDTMWIYVRHEAYWWSKTPTFFFELSPEGAVAGFRLTKPEASALELFRERISDESDGFFEIVRRLEKAGLTETVTEEYKRKKEGAKPFNERWYNLRSISVHTTFTDGRTLYSKGLKDKVLRVFDTVYDIEEYFNGITKQDLINKTAKEISDSEPYEKEMAKAPKVDFMW